MKHGDGSVIVYWGSAGKRTGALQTIKISGEMSTNICAKKILPESCSHLSLPVTMVISIPPNL